MAGRQKTTFAKMSRETKVTERKAIKEMRKQERREEIDRARAEGREVWKSVDVDDTSLDRPDRQAIRPDREESPDLPANPPRRSGHRARWPGPGE